MKRSEESSTRWIGLHALRVENHSAEINFILPRHFVVVLGWRPKVTL
jgi:hypothetical protein